MIKEAMAYLLELKKDEIVQTGGRNYSTDRLIPVVEPVRDAFGMHTLEGLLNWTESSDAQECFIQVVNWKRVIAVSKLFGDFKQRDMFVEVNLLDRDRFPFGRYLELEEFIIKLQCTFVDTPQKKAIIDMLAKVDTSEVIQSEDDGIAQKVVTKNEINRRQKTDIAPIAKLRPYRTFCEVEQPESPFLLRLQHVKGDLPSATMFEADGGAWKIEAVDNIATLLKNETAANSKVLKVFS